MRVCVTGSEGYIGSVLVPYLRARGHHVRAFDAGFFAACHLRDPEHASDFIQGDVRDVSPEVFESMDAVIHLAGLSNDVLGDLDPALTHDVNVVGTERVARAARDAGVPHLVFASSCSVYGPGDGDRELTESAPRDPLTAYATSKAAGEDLLHELATEAFTCTSLRAATVYGPSPRLRLDLVLNELTLMAVQDGRVVLKSSGAAWRPFVYLDDLCAAYAAVVEAGPPTASLSVFNVGSAHSNYQVIGAADVICHATGARLTTLEGAPTDTRNYRVGFDRFPETFPSWRADVTVPDGVRALADFLRSSPLPGGTLEDPRFRRLPHLVGLIRDGVVGPDLRFLA